MQDQSDQLGRMPRRLAKVPTGIRGVDQVLYGGVPKGRPTLVAGNAGCGKTLFGMQFLVHGALEHGEPGVFLAFEERIDELVANFSSLGIDLSALEEKGLLSLDHVRVERREYEDTGEYDLEGLFLRLGFAIDSIGAKRVVLDTIEILFGGLPNEAILRTELHRLFHWLKDRGVTAVITGESGVATLTRQGLEEYVSDCVILLKHEVEDQISTRRLRVVKYRGSAHGTNEYPFLIDDEGITVLPVTSLKLDQEADTRRIPTGIDELDDMMGGEGFFRGSSVLVSGAAGTGKSSVAASFVAAACARGERALYVSFEESRSQIIRNMASISIDLGQWADQGLLRFHTTRAASLGLEMHLVQLFKLVNDFQPAVVVIDPLTSLTSIGTTSEIGVTVTRLVDFLKTHAISAVYTSLVRGDSEKPSPEESVSSLVDTWLLLRNVENSGERNRTLYLLKSRGMPHSNQVREFIFTDEGIHLADVYIGPAGVLTGTARFVQEAKEAAEQMLAAQELERRRRGLERRRNIIEARIDEMHADLQAEHEEFDHELITQRLLQQAREAEQAAMLRMRQGSAESG